MFVSLTNVALATLHFVVFYRDAFFPLTSCEGYQVN